ncbi:hypothetical protein AVEN_129346-1 [Araneus ventricosus]|uniref:Uncharacterized protein n=1 Tax=Araneus ventricosus TaxID=182803 RepID=A0A4Y2WG73_ARAVE|nr:hypothetical protein AVEN_129346-1 [Araneus ventricosus]
MDSPLPAETETPEGSSAMMDFTVEDDSMRCAHLSQLMENEKEARSMMVSLAKYRSEKENGSPFWIELGNDLQKRQMELDNIKSEVSAFGSCPVVNCAVHVRNSNRSNHKRSLTNESDGNPEFPKLTRTSVKSNRKLVNDFQLPSKRLTAKTNVVPNDNSNLNVGTTSDNRFSNLPSDVNDDGEASQNQALTRKPPPIMLKRQENFTAQLKCINENFGPVVAKSGGIFIKLYPKDPEEHAKLTRFLTDKQMEYYVIVPKWERPIKVVI